MAGKWAAIFAMAALLGGAAPGERQSTARQTPLQPVADGDWPMPGRTADEGHHSPLDQISAANVAGLKLAWYVDLDVNSANTIPIAVDGIVYVAAGMSIVHAIDGTTGDILWRYDPEVGMAAGDKLRFAWGIRGLTYDRGRLFVGTQDGRLIAIDAKTGTLLWSAQTTEPDDARYITGAPRVIGDNVIIGHGGAEFGPVRGYVTAYNTSTGKQAWRFWTVPGNPADGFENETMRKAAATWSGRWWDYGGGGGTVWSGITYDPEYDRVYIGVGNAGPWNWKVRNPGGGDNLFLASIVALDAKTGEYAWHYQVNPNDAWDYSAAMDMVTATLTIDGRPRKVLMQAPKNGFFYVIDRDTGKPISAEKVVRATWASGIDLKTGRPIETPNIRYETKPSTLWPSMFGGHNFQAMAFHPGTKLVYLSTLDLGATWSDEGFDASWRPRKSMNNAGLKIGLEMPPKLDTTLTAWDPVRQRKVWEVPTPTGWGPGVMSTGGGLVFQGQMDGRFTAWRAEDGQRLWQHDAGVSVTGTPISYAAKGTQYVAVIAAPPVGSAEMMAGKAGLIWDYRAFPRRLMGFSLTGRATAPALPRPGSPPPMPAPDAPSDPALAKQGQALFMGRCLTCHGSGAIAAGAGPDLRASEIPLSAEAFAAVVSEGALRPRGMPRFGELSATDVEALRHFVRSQAEAALAGKPPSGVWPPPATP